METFWIIDRDSWRMERRGGWEMLGLSKVESKREAIRVIRFEWIRDIEIWPADSYEIDERSSKISRIYTDNSKFSYCVL